MHYRFVLLILILGILGKFVSSAQIPELIGVIRSDTSQTLFGMQILPVGDQNNDGKSDLLIWDYRVTNYLYYGGYPVDTVVDLRINESSPRSDYVDDLNNDGYMDIILPGRANVGYKLSVFYAGPTLDTLRDLWFGDDTLYGIGITVVGDDINANGTNEIIVQSHKQWSVVLFELGPQPDSTPDLELTPANLSYGQYASFGDGLITGDFNGDGQRDLAVTLRPGNQDNRNGAVYLYWGGPTFDTIPDMIITRPGTYSTDQEWFGNLLVNLGDFNADGYEDFYAGPIPSDDITAFIYFGGPDIDTIPDIIIPLRAKKAASAGDLNNDGYPDLITSDPAPFATVGDVKIFFGGPDADSVVDIRIFNRDVPEFLTEFGMDCTGIGDFNGDGIDDFAFSAIDWERRGSVFIFAGFDSVITDVEYEYEYEPTVPTGFILHQNYPNPFNPSTTIKFDLPHRDHIKLAIVNTLGQTVRTLLNSEYASGSYLVVWNGKSADGTDVASGVYYYRISSTTFTDSRKMLLVR